ncbi:hypothetical protein JOC86_000578 [Bacillus pakistanensis]|uniref:Uncharacterized protein n=1 Tax=Rossellomorea pakistanensis TaxID=992288 RepID=A0ABS2N853_9BACI|nr:hypothetical protein [Bacillus pakistanensis]MBM7584041.1 hypothetical protein [Bacillus pakistanensis]
MFEHSQNIPLDNVEKAKSFPNDVDEEKYELSEEFLFDYSMHIPLDGITKTK